jgi:hypothetical protein
MNSNRIFLVLLFSVFLFSSISYSQNKNKAAEDLAVKLQQKVLLSNDQTIKVKDILINYLQNPNQSSLKNSQKSISGILDKRQSAKYDIVEKDWWNTVQKAASDLKQ